MVVNSSALVKWKVYTYPYGMNIQSQSEFEERILQRARKAGIPCTISYEGMSLDSLMALIGMSVSDCMVISRKEKSDKKGLLRRIARQAFASQEGDFIITFGKEGVSVSMNVYKSNSAGALLDLLEGASSTSEPTSDHWTLVMEKIIEEVAEECR